MQHSPGVFVLKDENTLINLRAADFATEDDFQRLLAKFPELLVGDQIDALAPKRFILVQREAGIGSEAGSTARWSIDHLFLDQDGVPTLVEVKRSVDTRLRREVVGQMLDYAANGVRYWPAEELRWLFEQTCGADGRSPDHVLQAFTNSDPDAFWAAVNSNLLAGRIRMLFVADRIPPELRTVVEFLNEQMSPAEVLAIELRQYEGQGLRTIVPVVIGQTQTALQKHKVGASTSKPGRTREEFLAALAERNPEAVENAIMVLDWMAAHADRIQFRPAPAYSSVQAIFLSDGHELPLLRLWSNGDLSIQCAKLPETAPAGTLEVRAQLISRLRTISGVSLPADAVSRSSGIKLVALGSSGMEQVLTVLDWWRSIDG